MTNKRILELAWSHALENWSREDERLKKHPDNRITKARVERYWKEQQELRDMLLEAEKAEQ